MFTSLKRTTRAGYKNLRRQFGLTFATVSILVLTVFLLGFLFFLEGLSDFLIFQIKEKADVSVYFKEDIQEREILQMKDKISQLPEVKEINYVSKEEALERFKSKYQDNSVLMEALEEVGGNPLLAALNIKAWQASQYEAISQFLEGADFQGQIYKVNYSQNKNLVEKVFDLSGNIKTGTSIFILIFAFISILVAFNTVRLAIYHSREEIAIQRLVGAKNWFIRGPFIIQGAIMGAIAGLISLLISVALILALNSGMKAFFSGFDAGDYLFSNFLSIILIQLGLGLVLGVVSSVIAIRRYLRV